MTNRELLLSMLSKAEERGEAIHSIVIHDGRSNWGKEGYQDTVEVEYDKVLPLIAAAGYIDMSGLELTFTAWSDNWVYYLADDTGYGIRYVGSLPREPRAYNPW